MKYQKIINILDNTLSQPCKFRTKTWFVINYDSRETCNTNSQIKFKTSVRKYSFMRLQPQPQIILVKK